LIEEFQVETDLWYRNLKPHIQKAYKNPANGYLTQVPVLLHILQKLQYPGTGLLQQELNEGFQMIGHMNPGVGWPTRTDSKYQNPRTLTELREFNHDYVWDQLLNRKVDKHVDVLASEIAAEVAKNRMEGPFQAPLTWPRKTVPMPSFNHTKELLPLPDADPIIAIAFSIEQIGSDGSDKVRRGEDWKRSGHNSACSADDGPVHHDIDHYV
jgi:hypothetical protein